MDFQHFLTYMTDQGKLGFLMAKDWETGKLHFFVGSCHGLNTAIDMNQVYNSGVELPEQAGMVIFFGEWE